MLEQAALAPFLRLLPVSSRFTVSFPPLVSCFAATGDARSRKYYSLAPHVEAFLWGQPALRGKPPPLQGDGDSLSLSFPCVGKV